MYSRRVGGDNDSTVGNIDVREANGGDDCCYCCYCCCDGSDDDDDNDDDDVVAVGDIVISSLIRLRAVCKMD